MSNLEFLHGERIRSLIDLPQGVDALRAALVDDIVNPENDGPRLFNPAPDGEFLLMPSSGTEYCGVKSLTLAPNNPYAGKPRVQGIYTLFCNEDLAPVALLDAIELTLLRTPAATLLAAVHILRARGQDGHVDRVAIIGTGPQADRHARGVADLIRPNEITIIGRRTEAAERVAASLAADSIPCRVGTHEDVRQADLVICVTSSQQPVFENSDITGSTIVLAVGTHGLDAREVPPEFSRRAHILVEGRGSAQRESGNLIPARSAEELNRLQPPNLQDLAKEAAAVPTDQPVLYSGVGMAWEDLAIATAIHHCSQRIA